MHTPSGHKSIVNSVLFHPSLLHIVTAGIERHVILHSPTKSSPCTRNLELTPASVRALPEGTREDRTRFFRAISLGLGTNEMDEDEDTVALFDEYVFQSCERTDSVAGELMMVCRRIIRTEGEGRDIFLSRRCDESDDEEEDEDEDDSDEDVDWC